ncbi:MAG: DUF3987 domain-containing protein, partial [Bacteroidota bacterium]
MIALPVLAVLAAAVGNSYRIGLKRSWSEHSALWCVTVTPSGGSKSPALNAALRPVYGLSREAHEQFEHDYEVYEAAVEHYNSLSRAQKRAEERPRPPKPQRYRISDATVESVVERHSDSPRGLLLARDELAGWFASFDRYSSGKGGDMPAWIEMYGGNPVVIDRKTGTKPSLRIERPNVSVCGTIQPGVLREHLTTGHFESGFAMRLLLCEPPVRVPSWSDADVTHDVSERYERLVRALYARSASEQVISLTSEAKSLWVAQYDLNRSLAARLPSGPRTR